MGVTNLVIIRGNQHRVYDLGAGRSPYISPIPIGYLVLKIFREKSLQLKKLRVITAILLIITFLIFLVGMVESMHPYFPHGGYPLP